MGMMCLVSLDGVFPVEFPRTQELWIPAFAGMMEYFPRTVVHLRGNDVEVVLCGNNVSGQSGWCFSR